MNNFQDNNSTSFGFNDSNIDPFDPFGIGSGTSFQTSSDPVKKDDPESMKEASQNDDTNDTKQVKTDNSSSTQSKKSDDGVTVKTVKAEEEPEEDKTPANFKIGSKSQEIRIKLKPHNLSFNEEYFLKLLAGSISLNRDEKKRILDSIPNLRQTQVNQLIEIFEDEKSKFAELPEKHKKELAKLDKKHNIEWMSIEDEYLSGEKKQEDNAKADEIRKKLGL